MQLTQLYVVDGQADIAGRQVQPITKPLLSAHLKVERDEGFGTVCATCFSDDLGTDK